MENITLSISGMSCGHCAMRVTNALNGLDGVRKAVVDLAKKTAEVAYDDKKVDKARMAEAVKEAGYAVEG